MKDNPGVGLVLAAELENLNQDQREAACHDGDCVVRAGPGSGKTRTLVAKIGYLLDAQVPPRQGVAAITYTRQAAREILARLDRMGVRPGRRLAYNTVHGWCLSAILRPYGPLVGLPAPGTGGVIDENSATWVDLLQSCLGDVGLPNLAQWEKHTITKLRREIAAGLIGNDDQTTMVRVARLFDDRLLAAGRFDFDAMVARSLQIVREQPPVARLLAARYPWLVVDEYQDLGPVLHALVLELHDAADVRVSAFGDPDQSLMGFTGADPRYLNELAERPSFRDLSLGLNYRCGQTIIAASHAALGEQRTYRAVPDRADDGVIDLVSVNGGLDEHAATVVKRIKTWLAAGIAGHDMAILYPAKGPLLSALTEAFDSGGIAYVHERDQRLPTGELADFVRDCSARAVAGYQPVGFNGGERAAMVPTLGELAHQYEQLREASDARRLPGRTADRRLADALNGSTVGAATPLGTWLGKLSGQLDLAALAEGSPTARDHDALEGFATAAKRHGLTVADIAGALRLGKVTLTTYHSAKGREWDVVILPGLVDGIMPGRGWSKQLGRHPEPPPDRLRQDRRSFYVGLTRAKKTLVLVYGTYWKNAWGVRNEYGISRFVEDVLAHMRNRPDVKYDSPLEIQQAGSCVERSNE